MADPTLYSTNQSYVLAVKEASRGVAPTTGFIGIPVKTPQVAPNQTYLNDQGYRGSPVDTYDIVLGTRYDEYDITGDVHLDSFPLLIESILGGADTVTGTVAPYTHTQVLLNSASTGSQPPSYTFQNFNGYICQQITGAQCVSLELDFTATGAIGYTAKFYGLINTTIGAPTVPAFTFVDKLIPAWSNAVSLGGTPNASMIDGKLTIDRSTQAVFTSGQQGPYSIFTGPIKVTGSLTFATISADPIYALGYAAAGALTFTATDPSSTHTLLTQMTKAQLETTKYDPGQLYSTVTASFEAESNSTDATTGFSPIKFVTTNAVSTAFS